MLWRFIVIAVSFTRAAWVAGDLGSDPRFLFGVSVLLECRNRNYPIFCPAAVTVWSNLVPGRSSPLRALRVRYRLLEGLEVSQRTGIDADCEVLPLMLSLLASLVDSSAMW